MKKLLGMSLASLLINLASQPVFASAQGHAQDDDAELEAALAASLAEVDGGAADAQRRRLQEIEDAQFAAAVALSAATAGAPALPREAVAGSSNSNGGEDDLAAALRLSLQDRGAPAAEENLGDIQAVLHASLQAQIAIEEIEDAMALFAALDAGAPMPSASTVASSKAAVPAQPADSLTLMRARQNVEFAAGQVNDIEQEKAALIEHHTVLFADINAQIEKAQSTATAARGRSQGVNDENPRLLKAAEEAEADLLALRSQREVMMNDSEARELDKELADVNARWQAALAELQKAENSLATLERQG